MDEVNLAFGRVLMQAQKWQQAESVIRKIVDDARKVQGLQELGSALAMAQYWEQACQVWEDARKAAENMLGENAEPAGKRAAALCGLSTSIAQTLQEIVDKKLMNIAQRTSPDDIQDQEGMKIATLPEAYKPLLRLIQHSWFQAKTRRYATRLLPMATELVAVLPMLGIVLGKSFTQVDTFLQGDNVILKKDNTDHISPNQMRSHTQKHGSYDEALQLYLQSVKMFEQLDSLSEQATSLGQLDSVPLEQGSYDETWQFYQQGLEIAVRLGNLSERATSLGQLDGPVPVPGSYEGTRQRDQQILEVFEWQGNQEGQALTLTLLGSLEQEQGNYEEAQRFYQQSLELFEQLGNQRDRADTLYNLGDVASEQEQYEEAQWFYQQSLQIFVQLGDQDWQARVLNRLEVIEQEHRAEMRETPLMEEEEIRQEEALTIRYAIGKLINVLAWFNVCFETVLAIRLIFKFIGANQGNLFVIILYGLTYIALLPFSWLKLTSLITSNRVFEWTTLIVIVIYWLISWVVRRFLVILISPPEGDLT